MDSESRKLLLEMKEQLDENTKILHSLRGHVRWVSFLSVAKWLIVIVVTVASYYYAMPYIESTIKLFQGLQESSQKINDASNSIPQSVADFLKKL